MSPLFERLSEHLTYLGYRAVPGSAISPVPPDLRLPDDLISAEHDTKPIFWVLPLGHGAFFRALFFLSAEANSDRFGFFEFLNSANKDAVLARYYHVDDYLMVGAWYGGDYIKEQFAVFYDQYIADLGLMAGSKSEQALKYLSGPSIKAQRTPA